MVGKKNLEFMENGFNTISTTNFWQKFNEKKFGELNTNLECEMFN